MSSAPELRAVLAVLAALAMLAVVACKSSSPPQQQPPPPRSDAGNAGAGPAQDAPLLAVPPAPRVTQQPEPRAVAVAEPAIALPRQESFALLDAGRGARAKLRYTLAAGTSVLTVETALSSRHLERGEFSRPTALPALRDGFAITIDAGQPGQLELRALAGEAASTSADADAYLAAWRTLLQNRRISVTVDDRGGITAVSFHDDPSGARSAKARDELYQRLLALIVPLPVEPVGTGARWRVTTILRQGPAYAKQTATYTLTARGPASWKLHVALQRVGEQQHVADPSLPPGTTAELLGLFRALEGDVELSPASPMITAGSLAIESRLHVKLQGANQGANRGVNQGVIEQLFEDTGTVTFSLCASSPGPCPEGFAPGK
jgi:hypothetical protein